MKCAFPERENARRAILADHIEGTRRDIETKAMNKHNENKLCELAFA
jgi:hypothetical protein